MLQKTNINLNLDMVEVILSQLYKRDVSEITLGEYMTHAMLIDMLEIKRDEMRGQ